MIINSDYAKLYIKKKLTIGEFIRLGPILKSSSLALNVMSLTIDNNPINVQHELCIQY